MDTRFQKPFHHAILHIFSRCSIKIQFKNMAHNICRTCCRLVFWHSKCINRVHDRIFRIQQNTAHLLLIRSFFVVNYRKSVHFRTGCRQRKHRNNRECFCYQTVIQHQIPRTSLMVKSRCNRLRTVNRTAAANRNHHINLIFTADLHTTAHRTKPWIWLHARKVPRCNSCLF